MSNCLWVEKYRPKSLDDYIGNEHIKSKVKIYLENNDIPMLLFFGPAGTGKTTCAKIIINHLNCDYLYINASDENGIDIVRNKIKNFASTIGFSDIKIIILDEFDFFSANAMAALRNTMESFSAHTRFILTCNYVEKIIPPILSRVQTFDVQPPSKGAVAKHVANILTKENVKFSQKDLAEIVNAHYPDIRKIIQTCELQTLNGELKLDSHALLVSDSLQKIFNELANYKNKTDNILINIRQLIADNRIKTFEAMFRFIYDKLDTLPIDMVKKSMIIVTIAEYQFKDIQVVDREINIMAMFIEILNILKQ